jgi:hypothetical protein
VDDGVATVADGAMRMMTMALLAWPSLAQPSQVIAVRRAAPEAVSLLAVRSSAFVAVEREEVATAAMLVAIARLPPVRMMVEVGQLTVHGPSRVVAMGVVAWATPGATCWVEERQTIDTHLWLLQTRIVRTRGGATPRCTATHSQMREAAGPCTRFLWRAAPERAARVAVGLARAMPGAVHWVEGAMAAAAIAAAVALAVVVMALAEVDTPQPAVGASRVEVATGESAKEEAAVVGGLPSAADCPVRRRPIVDPTLHSFGDNGHSRHHSTPNLNNHHRCGSPGRRVRLDKCTTPPKPNYANPRS